ncbi:hypothetical protein [Sedimentibacter sp.]|uniref:hypothetical protein n=1 Tax=Sedimentibacter sp. TaxID=1960295 RepID=UPI0028B14035|nr:hypothetical protein [Sedimentibacter sp.]
MTKIIVEKFDYKISFVLCKYLEVYKIGEPIYIAKGRQVVLKLISDITINVPGLNEDWCILSLVDL